MQKRLVNKRGISPLIATVILIGFAVALFLILFIFARDFVLKAGSKEECGPQEMASLNIAAECSGNLKCTVINNGKKIDAFIVVAYTSAGGTGLPISWTSIDTGEEFETGWDPLDSQPTEVEVIPGVVKDDSGEPKLVMCSQKLVRVQVQPRT